MPELFVNIYFLSLSVSSGFAMSKLWKDFHLNQQAQITPEPGLCQKIFKSQSETKSRTRLTLDGETSTTKIKASIDLMKCIAF